MFDFLLGRGSDTDRAAHATTQTSTPTIRRPTIALALGGGAARGFAHIGVVRALIARGFEPEVIAGTSIGAVVGAMYATGHLDAFEEWARGLTRRSIFSYLDFTFFGSGIINGDKLAERLKAQLGDATIDALPLRFAAIATEVGTGHEIWLTRGSLADGLRAAYALPGVFTPVLIGNRWLVDGALVNPVPVSAARALGARLVVAVNLNADLFGRGTIISSFGPDEPEEEWLQHVRNRHGMGTPAATAAQMVKRQVFGSAIRPGFPTIMMEAFNIMQDRVTRARLAGDPPDVMVSPRLGEIGLLDFHRAGEAIDIGREAAERALAPIEDALKALA
ncbi:MAG: patatin-like phospholipase family protein [Variibacter sp.]|nr:patatin-like phospholipase family protein [Variibacter sp.]